MVSSELVFLSNCRFVENYREKYGLADYRYFKNGNTQHCNIFRHNKYNFQLLCVKFQLHMSNVTKVMNLRRMIGKTGLYDKAASLSTNIFYHPSLF